MKIIFSNYDDIKNPYYSGGGARSIHEVAKRLSLTNEVTVFTGNYPKALGKITDNVNYKRLGVTYLGPKLGQLAYQSLLPIQLLKTDFDVWIESFTPPYSTAFLPLFTQKPVVGLVHMLASEDMKRKYGIDLSFIENTGLRTYRNFIVVTNSMKVRIAKVNPSADVEVIPNGVELIKSSTSIKGSDKYLLFLGRIEVDQKGLDLLIDAYKKIVNKSQIKLKIAGNGSEKDMAKLKQLINNNGLKDNIKLLGWVDKGNKQKLLQSASVVIIPSRYETFSVVALEAMASGTPVVSFDIGGLSWLPSEHVHKVKAFDTDMLAKGVLDILNKKLILSQGNKFAQKFNWDDIALKYEKLLQKLVNTNASIAVV